MKDIHPRLYRNLLSTGSPSGAVAIALIVAVLVAGCSGAEAPPITRTEASDQYSGRETLDQLSRIGRAIIEENTLAEADKEFLLDQMESDTLFSKIFSQLHLAIAAEMGLFPLRQFLEVSKPMAMEARGSHEARLVAHHSLAAVGIGFPPSETIEREYLDLQEASRHDRLTTGEVAFLEEASSGNATRLTYALSLLLAKHDLDTESLLAAREFTRKQRRESEGDVSLLWEFVLEVLDLRNVR
jgi:hypothetical protein